MAIKQHLTIGKKRVARTFPKRDQFAAELAYFSDCVINDKEPEPSGLEGMADVRIVEAIYESARTKREVQLPEFRVEKRPTIHPEIRRPAHGKPQMIHTKPPSREAA
jgi:glucose-fructose oxidoreductase